MRLASASAFDAPLIDPAFMQTRSDLATLTEAVKAAHRFAAAPAWRDFIITPFVDTVNTTTDADIHAYITQQVATFRHPMGTARISTSELGSGVVNSKLLVENVAGLRIVDASIFVRIRSSCIVHICDRAGLTALLLAAHLRCTSPGTRVRNR